jgi:hypothetical protein
MDLPLLLQSELDHTLEVAFWLVDLPCFFPRKEPNTRQIQTMEAYAIRRRNRTPVLRAFRQVGHPENPESCAVFSHGHWRHLPDFHVGSVGCWIGRRILFDPPLKLPESRIYTGAEGNQCAGLILFAFDQHPTL